MIIIITTLHLKTIWFKVWSGWLLSIVFLVLVLSSMFILSFRLLIILNLLNIQNNLLIFRVFNEKRSFQITVIAHDLLLIYIQHRIYFSNLRGIKIRFLRKENIILFHFFSIKKVEGVWVGYYYIIHSLFIIIIQIIVEPDVFWFLVYVFFWTFVLFCLLGFLGVAVDDVLLVNLLLILLLLLLVRFLLLLLLIILLILLLLLLLTLLLLLLLLIYRQSVWVWL